MVHQVEQGLGGGWHRVSPDTTAPGYPLSSDQHGLLVVFVSGSGEAYDLRSPQVELLLSGSEQFSPAQLPPRYQLAITVRSAGVRNQGR
ncbi:MAG: hypothetical protein ACREOQ_22190, partial [Gemmatimonadales bacterium]